MKQITSVKQLTRNDGSKIKGIIFANSTYADITTLVFNTVEYYRKEKVDFVNQFDLIFINNRGILLNFTEESGLKIGSEKTYGIYFLDAGEDSLAYLIKIMNTSPLSEMRMRESVLVPFLRKYLRGDYKVKMLCEYIDGKYTLFE